MCLEVAIVMCITAMIKESKDKEACNEKYRKISVVMTGEQKPGDLEI